MSQSITIPKWVAKSGASHVQGFDATVSWGDSTAATAVEVGVGDRAVFDQQGGELRGAQGEQSAVDLVEKRDRCKVGSGRFGRAVTTSTLPRHGKSSICPRTRELIDPRALRALA